MPELNLVEKVIALEGVELLAGLGPDQLASIATIATEVPCRPGCAMLAEAEPVDALYVVVEGSAALSRNGEAVGIAGAGTVIGVWALFDQQDPLRLTATGREDTRLLRIGREEFYDLLADNSDITAAIFSTLVRRFEKLVEQ